MIKNAAENINKTVSIKYGIGPENIGNNKFNLDFSDEEFVQEIEFLSNNDYYIASLNCNLIVKEHIDDKKTN